MRRARVAILALALAVPLSGAQAEPDPADTARAAAQALREAGRALEEAEEASDRVAALTETIRAYEDGLAALREGLRRASIRERAITLSLEARRAELSRLLGALTGMEQAPGALVLLHPAGPLGTARAGMMLGDVTPSLQAEAERLRAQLQEVALMRSLQQSAADTLAEGLDSAQRARTALSQAMAERRVLPRRFAEDPDRLRALLNGSDTLDGFAAGLIVQGPATAPGGSAPPDFAARRGRLPLPVQGTVLRAFQEADAAGVERPGLVLATRPLALVTTPAPATIRYRGPLLDYGNVMILEPAEGYLLVLAGLAQVYGDPGEVLPAGHPVGLMGGADPGRQAVLDTAPEGGGERRSETLYMELRKGGRPVDPTGWFAELPVTTGN
ncbi:septal ring factor EnvC (AmiA/AmiB activator) [Rhodovulum bhavnagarense]|uniref:Septal ring factor EnvC (AmiA/AmiB activator) n=1 Tax=Rhodovulum bhavnagarense TaxID=992286 RepID=A0A4R2R9L7_9RHOB|nr:peptidoglycan DD-metalloendopeptidase family protein [Rhodovulum bhavnagarense]TCP59920.1 septal ring factor EnvC (AmiA/AmiB activator) [Rhodovulum bhavnagarense]